MNVMELSPHSAIAPLLRFDAPLQERVVRDATGLRDVHDAWIAFRRRRGECSPNTDPLLFAATVSAMGNDVQPYVVLLTDRLRTRGMIIGRHSTRRMIIRAGYRTFRTIALRCLDIVHGGIITDESSEACDAITAHLQNVLRRSEVEHVFINHLPTHHELFTSLQRIGVCGPIDRHWRYVLPDGSADPLMQQFSRKHRYNLRRAARLLSERTGDDVEMDVVDSSKRIETFLHACSALHEKSFQSALTPDPAQGGALRAVLETAAGAGRFCGFLLRCGERTLAYQFGVRDESSYTLIATAFDRDYAFGSPGQVLLVRAMEYLQQHGIRIIDYGFGDAPYKQMYGSTVWDEMNIRMYGVTWRARITGLIDRAVVCGERMTSRLSEREHLVRMVKKHWRRRIEQRAGDVTNQEP